MFTALIDDYTQMPLFFHLLLPALLAVGQFVTLLELSRLGGRSAAAASVLADLIYGLLAVVSIIGNTRDLGAAGLAGDVIVFFALLFLTFPALAVITYAATAMPLDARHFITGRAWSRRQTRACTGSMKVIRPITTSRPTLAGIRRNGGHR